jgi:hypothetical protein
MPGWSYDDSCLNSSSKRCNVERSLPAEPTSARKLQNETTLFRFLVRANRQNHASHSSPRFQKRHNLENEIIKLVLDLALSTFAQSAFHRTRRFENEMSPTAHRQHRALRASNDVVRRSNAICTRATGYLLHLSTRT